MKISITSPATIFDIKTDEPIADNNTLLALDGAEYADGNCYDYLDVWLADLGIIGGTVHCRYDAQQGLMVVTDYWAPTVLASETLEALLDDTLGQWDDGVGEGGFVFALPERTVTVVPETDKTLVKVTQEDDGRHVPPPPRVAICAREGDLAGLQAALRAGGDVNARLQGYSPLHLAIRSGGLKAVLLLLEHGADPNARDLHGDRPLHLAALVRDLTNDEAVQIATALLQRGADPNVVDNSGHTPAFLAEIRERYQLQQLLIRGEV